MSPRPSRPSSTPRRTAPLCALALALALLAAQTATARADCDLALVLAVDVSGSVDAGEYEIQMRGLAEALRDGLVAEALVRAEARVSLVQWTGSTRQEMTLPWVAITGFDALDRLAARIETAPRAWNMYSTAIGDALAFAARSFDETETCARRVIDVSGDGVSNEGAPPAELVPRLRAAGITVNALVIETAETDLTGYFWENVVTGPEGFVVTADGFRDYPERIRRKLIRETTMQMSAAPVPPGPASRHDGAQLAARAQGAQTARAAKGAGQ